MDDRLKETLSAMMDDEADELSVRRLLSHQHQDDVRAQFQRWQQMRDLIQRGSARGQSIDVSESVRDVLDGHTRPVSDPAPAPVPARRKWQWSAVAMVALGLAVGFSAGTGWNSASEPVPVETAERAAGVTELTEVPQVTIQGLDERQREQLSRYLLQHAQHNTVGTGHASMGYARAVSASGAGY